MTDIILNTCFLTTNDFRPIAYYTHLIPAAILLMMVIFVFYKKGRDDLINSFFLFITFLSLWLIGDLVTWVLNDYSLVVFAWSVLDFIEILFFFFGVYFFINYIKNENIRRKALYVMTLLSLPAFYITLMGYSAIEFDHANCELIENSFLVIYKVIMDILSIISIAILSIFAFRQNKDRRKEIVVMSLALIFLLSTFLITGYISSLTYIYEILLYGLFALPIFVAIIMFSIVRYEIFDLRIWSQQLIAYSLVILVASKIFFTDSTTDLVINIITLSLSIIFVYTLTRSIKKENEYKKKIEALNIQLETTNGRLRELDQQKSEFISLASHQLRSPLTAIKGYVSMIMEGDFGKFSNPIREALETIFKSTQALVVIVGDYLDISRIEQNKMKYDFTDFDIKELVKTVITEMTPTFEMIKLKLDFSFDENGDYFVKADQGKIKQVISNIVDNSSKYTKQGGITVRVERNEKDDILISIKDTGVGISPEVLPRLFEKFTRAPDASKANIMGTGLGLYIAKKIIEAHRGRIWAESEGKDKGSTFFIELESLHNTQKPQFKDAVTGKLPHEAEE